MELNDHFCSETKKTWTGLRLLNIQHDEHEFGSFAGWLLHGASGGGSAPGLRGGLTAGFAALRSYVGQLATSKPEESLTEAARQAVAHTNGSWGGGDRESMSRQHIEQS